MRLHNLLKSKIHRATVTEADLNYVGSITIDRDLTRRVGLLPGELVHVWDVENGERLETYVIEGEALGGQIIMNGPAAHRIKAGHRVIIAAFCLSDEPIEAQMILVDDRNRYVRDL